MYDPGMLSNKVSIVESSGGSFYGVLPEIWGTVAAGLKKSGDVLDLFEADAVGLLGAVPNIYWAGIVTDEGLSITDISDLTVGLIVTKDAQTGTYFYKSYGSMTAGHIATLSVMNNAIMTSLERYLNIVPSISETEQKYDWGYNDNAIEDMTVARSNNITGVVITRAVGNAGQFGLVYTAATNTLRFNGGVSQVAYLIAATPVPYKMTLVANDLVTKIDIIVTANSLPVGNTSDRIGIGTANGTSVDQPTNITGVTLIRPTGLVCSDNLVWTAAGTTLAWGGGVAVDVSLGGYYLLTDLAGNTVVALVDPDAVPAGNQTDAGLVVHRCVVSGTTDDLMINLMN